MHLKTLNSDIEDSREGNGTTGNPKIIVLILLHTGKLRNFHATYSFVYPPISQSATLRLVIEGNLRRIFNFLE